MTLQNQRRSRKRQHKIDTVLNLVVLGLTIGGVAIAVGSLPGCASSSRTRVEPAATSASHETRSERAGRTKTSTFDIEITPPAAMPGGHTDSQAEPQSTGAGFDGISPLEPVADSLRWRDTSGMSGARGIAPLMPVAYAENARNSPQVDPGIARAISEAVANGAGVKMRVTETEEIPLTADTANSTLSDTGSGLATSSDEAAIGFDGRKSGATLPWGGRSGKSSFGLDASLASAGVNALHIIGAIVILGAIVPLWSPPRRWGAAGVVAGVGLLIIAAGTVSEQAPWVFVLAILGFMGLAGWLGYEAWRNKRRKVALDAIVQGVENDKNALTKAKIASAAGDSVSIVKSETNAVKAKLKLRKPG